MPIAESDTVSGSLDRGTDGTNEEVSCDSAAGGAIDCANKQQDAKLRDQSVAVFREKDAGFSTVLSRRRK